MTIKDQHEILFQDAASEVYAARRTQDARERKSGETFPSDCFMSSHSLAIQQEMNAKGDYKGYQCIQM